MVDRQRLMSKKEPEEESMGVTRPLSIREWNLKSWGEQSEGIPRGCQKESRQQSNCALGSMQSIWRRPRQSIPGPQGLWESQVLRGSQTL